MDWGGGKDRRRAVACAVVILREEKGMIIGGIKVGHYDNLTRDSLARAFVLNRSLTVVTRQMEKIWGNDDTLDAILALTEEEAEKKL